MNARAETARQNALQLEVKKDGLKQLQSGEWTLSLKVHANDVPTPLLTAAMGTRYMLAMVEVGDNEEPVQQEKPKGKSYAQKAGICCNEPAFRQFLMESELLHPEGDPAAAIRFVCAVESRSELIEGTEAGETWRNLYLDYQNWLNS